jgi:hypothetical protein
VRGLRSEVYEWSRARIATAPKPVNELREPAPTRIGRVSMNERECPCMLLPTQIAIAAAISGPDIHLFSDLRSAQVRLRNTKPRPRLSRLRESIPMLRYPKRAQRGNRG